MNPGQAFPNPNGVAAALATKKPQPRWGWLDFLRLTQGSSCLATLGWMTQSLWDCPEVLSELSEKAKRSGCLNNLRQLALGTQMYSGDNNGLLVANLPQPSSEFSWVTGDMKNTADATNISRLQQGKLFPYVSQPALYRCPADNTQAGSAVRVRSYAMNGWVGSRMMETSYQQKGFRTFVRESEIAAARAPSGLWVTGDEHESTLDDGWFLVTMDDSRVFASFPGTRHLQGYILNFTDGHAAAFKFRDPASQDGARVTGKNTDWIRLKQMTTIP